jgi:hypothetical protein
MTNDVAISLIVTLVSISLIGTGLVMTFKILLFYFGKFSR